MSVWHTPQATSRTSTSPARGAARSSSCTTSGRSNCSSTAARTLTAHPPARAVTASSPRGRGRRHPRARGRPVERRQKTVTDGLHLAPAKALELLAHVLVVARQQIAPVAVADVRDARGGPDDVGEQHRAQRARDLNTARAGEELLDLLED